MNLGLSLSSVGNGEILAISPFRGTYPPAGDTIGEDSVGDVIDPIYVPVAGLTTHEETALLSKEEGLKIDPLPPKRTPVKAKILENMLINLGYDELETQFLVKGFLLAFI